MLVGAFLAVARRMVDRLTLGRSGAGDARRVRRWPALHAFLSITLAGRPDHLRDRHDRSSGLGISGYGFRLTLGAMSPAPTIPSFAPLELWGLAKLPIVGPILFGQHLLVYVALIIAVCLHVVLYRTRWGLDLRAVGEMPAAADAAGVSVQNNQVRQRDLWRRDGSHGAAPISRPRS